MSKLLFIAFLFFLISGLAEAQVLPQEGSVLNYRLIGFSVPPDRQAANYKFEIAAGNCITEASFKNKTILSVIVKNNKTIIEVPAFGSQYTWRVVSGTGKNNTKSGLHHYSTGTIPGADTNSIRCRIIKPAIEYKDAYVFSDATGALYDMSGHLVWYLPKIKKSDSGHINIRDLRITPQKTITYEIEENAAYEINYNGNILWKTPDTAIVSGDANEHYHHQFTRLENGHYMVLGQEFKFCRQPVSPGDTNLMILSGPAESGTASVKLPMSTIIEYDQKGNVVWSWKFSNYLNGTDLLYHNRFGHQRQAPAHENSFFFDERSKAIYLSCKSNNRIVKLAYPGGNILNIYDGNAGSPETGNSLFCGQHSCRLSQKGYLYLYNNNVCSNGQPPSILVMEEPVAQKGSLKKIWEYKCDMDSNYQMKYPSGGNVIELPGYSMFVSMAAPASEMFIVSMNKEILWSAAVEKWNINEKKWSPVNTYRASIIPNRKDLEQLIWNAEIMPPKY